MAVLNCFKLRGEEVYGFGVRLQRIRAVRAWGVEIMITFRTGFKSGFMAEGSMHTALTA